MWASGVKPSGGAGGASWTDSGNVTTPHFRVGDLTTDGNPHDLDLSGIVGAAAKLVLIRGVVQNSSAGKYILLKTKGIVNDNNVSINVAPVANSPNRKDGWVYTDPNGIITYFTTAGGWSTIDLTIGGWWNN